MREIKTHIYKTIVVIAPKEDVVMNAKISWWNIKKLDVA